LVRRGAPECRSWALALLPEGSGLGISLAVTARGPPLINTFLDNDERSEPVRARKVLEPLARW